MSALETGRYERKYIVTETTAAAVRQFLSAYMIPDPFMTAAEPRGYEVHSLYLDAPHLALYRQTAEGIKNRHKLRIRFYDPLPTSPAFLEIKTRISDTIFKQRATVSKRSGEQLLCGGMLGMADLVSGSDKSARALAEFCAFQLRLGASGTAFVSYWREAYVLPHAEGARVTFDRQIVSRPYDPGRGLAMPAAGEVVSRHHVVLELKYIGRAPGWMKDLVNSYNLERVSYPKYVYSIDALKLAPAMAG
jgi:VTC domain